MTENQLRSNVVSVMKGWLGWSEANGKFKRIIDTYNNHKPLAQGYKVKYTDEWCATAVSAAFINAGLTDIGFTECSCSRMINLYKAKGRWEERDSYIPKMGDVIMYDWDDNGIGDNKGAPDHVGLVVSVDGTKLTIIEGNKKEAVAYRSMSVNGKYIGVIVSLIMQAKLLSPSKLYLRLHTHRLLSSETFKQLLELQ